MIEDIKTALEYDKNNGEPPTELYDTDLVSKWLTALVEYHEAAEAYIENPSPSNGVMLLQELRAARKKLEG